MDELAQKVLGLINTRSDAHIPEEKFTYSDSLSQYIDIDFSEHEAKEHWKNICQTLEELENKLQKKVSLYLAIVDYFTGTKKVINSPVLVEIKVLRETEEMAMQDGLTGAFNRRYMDIYLRKEITRCNRYEKCFSVMLLDIDDFKKINDTYGHVVGDTILSEISKIFKSTIREEDVFCRYGGEEFLIIMPETTAEKAVCLYQRIKEKLLESDIHKSFNVTVSAGAARYKPGKDNLVNLIRYADIALYKAKAQGKNRIVNYDSE